MGTVLSAFRIGKIIRKVAAILFLLLAVVIIGSPGCGGRKAPSYGGHGRSVREFYEGTPQLESGAVPCMDAKTGRSNPLSYMDVADTGSGNVNSGRYGNNRNGGNRFHAGIDLDAEVGTPAYSVSSGEVIEVYTSAQWDGTSKHKYDGGGYGNYVKVRSFVDGKEVIMLYAHLDVNGVDVKPGQTVQAGTQLGRTGRTGNAYNVTNPHLHFETRDAETNRAINPEPFLNGQVSESGAFVNVVCDNRDEALTTMQSGYPVNIPGN